MIVRKYTDGDSNLELSVMEEDQKIIFEIENGGVYISVGLIHKEAEDLRDRLYDLIKEIQPKKEKVNG